MALEYADAITDTVRDVDDEGLYRTGRLVSQVVRRQREKIGTG